MAKTPRRSSLASLNQRIHHITDVIGSWGQWQRNIFYFYLCTSVFSAFHNLGLALMAPKVDYWCADNESENRTLKCFGDQAETIPCTKWHYDTSFFKRTVISEFDLVCGRSWLVSLTQSFYMAGMIVSSLVCGHLSDMYGRLPVLWVAIILETVAGLSCAFSFSIYQYMISRFILAVGAYGRYLTGFMLVIETTGAEQRALMGIVCRFGWALGCCLLPSIVYFLPNYVHIQLACTLPELVFFIWLYRIPESPRWQLARGCVLKANQELRRAAQQNKRRLTGLEEKLEQLRDKFVHDRQLEEAQRKVNFFDLWKTPNLRKNTLILCFTWFTTGYVYYGLSLNLGDLGGDLLTNFAIAGVLEVPAFALSIIAMQKYGRRSVQAAIMFGSGLGSLLAIPFYLLNSTSSIRQIDLSNTIQLVNITLGMLIKFFISLSYYTVYIYSAEVYPTLVRQVGVGSNAAASRLGMLIAPFVKEITAYTHITVSLSTFAAISIINGASVLFLPETKGKEIPDTLEDAENFNDLTPSKSNNTKMIATVTIEGESSSGKKSLPKPKSQPSKDNRKS